MNNRAILIVIGFMTGIAGTSLFYNIKLIGIIPGAVNQFGTPLSIMMPIDSIMFVALIILCIICISKQMKG